MTENKNEIQAPEYISGIGGAGAWVQRQVDYWRRRALAAEERLRRNDIGEIARIAYTAMTTETFGIPPGEVKKVTGSGGPNQKNGVTWEKLPRTTQETWQRVVSKVLSEMSKGDDSTK